VATLPPRAHPSTEGMAQLLALARFSSPELSSIVYRASQQHENEPPRWRDSEHRECSYPLVASLVLLPHGVAPSSVLLASSYPQAQGQVVVATRPSSIEGELDSELERRGDWDFCFRCRDPADPQQAVQVWRQRQPPPPPSMTSQALPSPAHEPSTQLLPPQLAATPSHRLDFIVEALYVAATSLAPSLSQEELHALLASAIRSCT